MAKEMEVWDILKDAGYTPIENRSIIVTYAAPNLSAKIANFISNTYYVLQICEKDIVLVPFGDSKSGYPLKKEVALELPISSIKSVEIRENGLNYNIFMRTVEGDFTLSTQQKELSDLRSAGALALDGDMWRGGTNWHKANLDQTLESLKAL